MTPNQTKNKFKHLTSLRGIAAVTVLIAHIVQIYWLRYEEFPHLIQVALSISSTFAVKVFFVLSGFLIAHSVEENLNRNSGSFDFKGYFAARVARIYPPFLYSLVVSIVVFTILYALNMPGTSSPMRFSGDIYSARDYISLSGKELVLSLIMLQGLLDINGPLWSLYIEVKLYFIFVFVYLFFNGKNKLFFAALFLFLTFLSLKYNPEFLRYSVIWIFGCMTYYQFGNPGQKYKLKLLACAGVVIAIIIYDIVGHYLKVPLVFQQHSFIFTELILSALISLIILKFKIRVPFAHEVGLFSYSLYVTHFPLLILIQSTVVYLEHSSLLASCIVSIFSFFAAILVSYIGGKVEAMKGIIQYSIVDFYKKIGLIKHR
jgi:peptidoglycan/LPS O-acetylase OafA/YrhL